MRSFQFLIRTRLPKVRRSGLPASCSAPDAAASGGVGSREDPETMCAAAAGATGSRIEAKPGSVSGDGGATKADVFSFEFSEPREDVALTADEWKAIGGAISGIAC